MSTINRVGIHFFLRTDRPNNKGDVCIYLLLTQEGRKVALSTGKRVQEKKWNATQQKVTGADETAHAINNYLNVLRAKAIEAINNLMLQQKPITLNAIKELLTEKHKNQNNKTLLTASLKHNEEMESLLGIKFAYGNFKNYGTTHKFLTRFIHEEYKRNDILLSELDLPFVNRFENWLLLKTLSKHNGAMKHIQRLKKIINWSIENDWLKQNPFTRFKISFDKHDRGYLTIDEIELIEKSSFSRNSLNTVRDIFLFQIYTGLAYTDIHSLKREHIVNNSDGKNWIVKKRDKTNIQSMIPLLPRAMSILNRQPPLQGNVFAVPPNQKMNYMLKTIAEQVGIHKNLTTHLARHTFATTITLLNGIPIETVSKMLGHTKISTTQIYAKITAQKISNDMEKLNDLF